MRDILNRMLQTRQQEALAQAIEEMDQMHQEDAAAAATALSDPAPATTVAEAPIETPSQIFQPLVASQTTVHSSTVDATSQARPSSTSDFTLPPLQRMGVNYAELPAFLMNMVDFSGSSSSSNDNGDGGNRLFRFGQHRHQHAHGSGTGGAGSGGIQRNQEYSHNHFALDDWNQLPSSRMDLNSDNDDLQFVAFSPIHQYQQQPRFNHQLQLRHLQQQSAAARLAASSALSPFAMMSRAPSGPPQEIDLTVSSSESDDDDDSESDSHGVFTGGDDDNEERDGEDEDGEVEIVHTRTATPAATLAVAAAIGGGASGNPPARYLTYTSVPPLRRKRRRQGSGDGTAASAAATADDPVNPEMFDGQRAESTNISMENNETIERFKKSLKCSICLDVIEEMTSTICGHVYCGKCIRLAIRVTAKCPLCQRKLRPKDVHLLYF